MDVSMYFTILTPNCFYSVVSEGLLCIETFISVNVDDDNGVLLSFVL